LKTEGEIKKGPPRDKGNSGYKTQNKHKQNKNTEK